MPDLKLARLPDRTPVKLTITVSPALHSALGQYAEVYHATYGQREKVEDLIPFMLELFLATDSGFRKAQKALQVPQTSEIPRAKPSTPARQKEPE